MSNPSKAKGSAWECAVRDYLRDRLRVPGIERLPTEGKHDRGDLSGIPSRSGMVVVECKAEKSIDLAGYMKELEVEMANAESELGAAVVKRRNKGVQDAYAVMPLWLFADIIEMSWR